MNNRKLLIVCDVQPDVVNKLPQPRLFCDLINVSVSAARQSGDTRIIYTQIRFPNGNYDDHIASTHPRLGILRKLPNAKWFTSEDLCIAGRSNDEREVLLTRTTFLPQADAQFIKAVGNNQHQTVTVMGYGPTVQTICHLLGDILAIPSVQIIKDCVSDETIERCQSFLNHGLLFRESVISLVDYLESLDVLHQRMENIETVMSRDLPGSSPPPNRYVCDVGRGGHISLFMPYLLQEKKFVQWPTQPWYQELSLSENTQYHCPLGRVIVPLCDEPQFGSGPRFFVVGRQFLDEKDLLHDLVPELMPPTFATLDDARRYAQEQEHKSSMLWFLKKVNQNGGRAVEVLKDLPTKSTLDMDEQLQAHVPRPLLWDGGRKCHVKTYYYLSTCSTETGVEWQLYLHDLYYLATADKPWSTDDASDECQITTMRTNRLYADHPWRIQWDLTERCERHLRTVMARAVEQGKLQVPTISTPASTVATSQVSALSSPTLQFEINSADWMLDESGRIYLIECNGIPVLYDGGQNQLLCTRGLELYDRLYKEDPRSAVVNDHELLRDAVALAMTGVPPMESLWKHVASIPAVGGP